MSEEKRLKARVVHKHKTYAEWYLDVYDESGKLRSNPFIPLDGELIIFDPDENCTYRRKKYGDGVSNVMELSFAEEIYVGEGDMPDNAVIQFIMDGSDEEQALKDELKEDILKELAQFSDLYIRPEDYGAKGDGKTDDSVAIQAAINAAVNHTQPSSTVYLSQRKYAISTGIVIDTAYDYPINFICNGALVYSGTGAAVTLKSSNFCNINISSISAENGTAFKADTTDGELGTNIVTINDIRASKIGIHLYTDTSGTGGGHNMFYNKFHIEGSINSTEACVYLQAATRLLGENYFWLGRLMGGATYGIKIEGNDTFGGAATNGNAGRNVFFCGNIEGLASDGCGIYLHNTHSNVFRSFRTEEAYGSHSITLSGECFANDIECSYINIGEIDITNLTVQNSDTNMYANILRSTKISGEGFYGETEVYVSSEKGLFTKQAENTWEAWTFTLKDGSTVTKQVVIA